MYKFQNHVEVLEAILEVRSRLPAAKNSYVQQSAEISTLGALYACLDVSELKSIVEDFKKINKRNAPRLNAYKKAA